MFARHHFLDSLLDSLAQNDGAVNQQLMRNPGQIMQQLSKAMDPRMLQQMGGAENMMKMFK